MKRTTFLFALLLSACGADKANSPKPDPGTVTLAVTSSAKAWIAGASLKLAATVTGAGKAATVTFSAEPEGAATLASQEGLKATFTLGPPGPVTFRACLDSAPDRCDTVAGTIDDGPPRLTVDAPLPGEEIDDPAGVTVRGSVQDGSASLQVLVNGTTVQLDGEGKFETTLPPRFGVEHLAIVADDGVTDAVTVEMDVLHAAAFEPATGEDGKPAYALEGAAGVWLGQDFFDDQHPLDRKPRPLVTRDLADIVELVASDMSLESVLPDPLYEGQGFLLSVPTADLGPPGVEIVLQDQGVDLFIHFASVTMTTAGTLSISGEAHDLAGTVTTSVTLHALLSVDKTSPDADVTAGVESVTVTLGDLAGTFGDPTVSAIFALNTSALRATFEKGVQDGITGLLDATLPSLLLGLLDGIDHALQDRAVDIDSPPLPRLALALNGRMSSVATAYRAALTAPLVVSMSTDVSDQHGGSRGVARMVVPPADLQFAPQGQVQIGVSTAFLNGLLHVLWSSGLLDLDLTDLLPGAAALVDSATLVPQLPPVLRPAREGEAHPLVLSLGQLEVLAVVGGIQLRFGVGVDVGADLALVDGKLALSIVGDPDVHAWVIDGDPSLNLDPAIIQAAIGQAWPDLAAALGSLVAIDLPLIGGDAIGGLSPSLHGLTMTLAQTDAGLSVQGETLLIPATITGTIP